jgi:hypothetical protein
VAVEGVADLVRVLLDSPLRELVLDTRVLVYGCDMAVDIDRGEAPTEGGGITATTDIFMAMSGTQGPDIITTILTENQRSVVMNLTTSWTTELIMNGSFVQVRK